MTLADSLWFVFWPRPSVSGLGWRLSAAVLQLGAGLQWADRLVCDGSSLMVERAQRRLCWTQKCSREGVCSVSESLITLCHLNPLSAELEIACVCVCVFAVSGSHLCLVWERSQPSAFLSQHLRCSKPGRSWCFIHRE